MLMILDFNKLVVPLCKQISKCMLLTLDRLDSEQLIKDCVKIHAIIPDRGKRCEVGMPIHFWNGNPRNKRCKQTPYRFGVGEVSRIEDVEINPCFNYVIIGGIKFASQGELDAIAINEGFKSWEEMKLVFPDVFVGKMIFWKKCQWL